MSKEYKIVLNDDDMELLHDDYSCVEIVVEKIVEQAKRQGYNPPKDEKPVAPKGRFLSG